MCNPNMVLGTSCDNKSKSLSRKTSRTNKHNRRLGRAIGAMESLENRQMLSLLGVAPGYPNIFFDTTGKINYTYNSATNTGDFAVTATAHNVTFSQGAPPSTVTSDPANNVVASFTINILVDGNGNVLPNQAGPNLIVTGDVTNILNPAQSYDGTLLEGDISQFGFLYTGTTANNFDFRFTVDPTTPGLMGSLYAGQDIGVTCLSLGNTFVGSFMQNFVGGAPNGAGANGNAGGIPTLTNTPPASIGGTVFEDLYDNGDFINTDVPIPGVTVTLTGTDNMGNPVDDVTTTAANGSYLFSDLNPSGPSGYTITEDQTTVPAPLLEGLDHVGTLGGNGTIQDVFSDIPVLAGQAGTFYNFGEIPPAKVSGTVFCDCNADGVQEAGENSLGGVTVTLTGTNDLGQSVSLTTTTLSAPDSSGDQIGYYSFSGLRPSNSAGYTITYTPPAGDHAGSTEVGTGLVLDSQTSSTFVLSTPYPLVSAYPAPAAGAIGINYNFAVIQPFGNFTGTVYSDTTGNGLTPDDTPLAGVVVDLYKDVNGNGVLDSSDGSPIATSTSNSSGQYSFLNVPVGKYILAETVPGDATLTAPNLPDYYAVTMVNCGDFTNNFDNYVPCTTQLKNVCFTLNNNGCKTTVTDLRGNTVQCETVTATFTVPAGSSPMVYSLVSYNAPDSYFNASDASQQTIFQDASGTFGPGTHSLTVTIPCNYYQIDFVCGAAINQLGPAGSNIFYSAQGRLISADNGGLHSDVDDESATMTFWANLGQSLIKSFGGSSSSTALGTWLSSTYPNIFGGTLLGNKTNATVASKFMSFYNVSGQKNQAQIMATALNVYASTLSLGGTAGTSYGFNPTAAGLGAADFNVGSNGAAFGVANNSTITVDQMLSTANSKSSNDNLYNGISSLLNSAYNEFGQVNGDGGIS